MRKAFFIRSFSISKLNLTCNRRLLFTNQNLHGQISTWRLVDNFIAEPIPCNGNLVGQRTFDLIPKLIFRQKYLLGSHYRRFSRQIFVFWSLKRIRCALYFALEPWETDNVFSIGAMFAWQKYIRIGVNMQLTRINSATDMNR